MAMTRFRRPDSTNSPTEALVTSLDAGVGQKRRRVAGPERSAARLEAVPPLREDCEPAGRDMSELGVLHDLPDPRDIPHRELMRRYRSLARTRRPLSSIDTRSCEKLGSRIRATARRTRSIAVSPRTRRSSFEIRRAILEPTTRVQERPSPPAEPSGSTPPPSIAERRAAWRWR
jgi:hypothetical protein